MNVVSLSSARPLPRFGMTVIRAKSSGQDTPLGHTRFKYREAAYFANDNGTPKGQTGDQKKLNNLLDAHYDATQKNPPKGNARITGPSLEAFKQQLVEKATAWVDPPSPKPKKCI